MSLRDKIQAAVDIERETVEVPQWDVKLTVKSMTGRTRAAFLRDFANPEAGGSIDFEKLYPDLIILCAVDPDTDDPIFSEDDRQMLLDKSGAAIEIVALAAMKVSGLQKDAADAAGKDSSSTSPNGASVSS